MIKKITITLLIILLSITGYTQTPKADSIKQAEQQKIIIQIETKTTIEELKFWLYKNYLTGEKFDEFMRYYNAFINYKFSLMPKTDSTTNKTQPKK